VNAKDLSLLTGSSLPSERSYNTSAFSRARFTGSSGHGRHRMVTVQTLSYVHRSPICCSVSALLN
jgi:hypothetical protein